MAARIRALCALQHLTQRSPADYANAGASEVRSGWNAWIVGGLTVVSSMVRLTRPLRTAGFSLANVILGFWILVSPFVFGYAGQQGRLINRLSAGAVILGFSPLSFLISKDLNTRIGASDDWDHAEVQNSDESQVDPKAI